MSDKEKYEAEVRAALQTAYQAGARSFKDLLLAADGADPRTVHALIKGFDLSNAHGSTPSTRSETSAIASRLPAADPVMCQWWFTIDCIERLAQTLFRERSGDGSGSPIACIGAPTVAYHYARTYGPAHAFEIDPDVGALLQKVSGLIVTRYDARDELSGAMAGKFSSVLVDPPWYPEYIRTFLARALTLVADGGSVFCSMPPRLTRSTVVAERQELLAALAEANVEIVSFAPRCTSYFVPAFERRAYSDVEGFDGSSWRTGDLLHLRKGPATKPLVAGTLPKRELASYARDPRKFRVFVRSEEAAPSDEGEWLVENTKFRSSVSRRDVSPDDLDWWTTERAGGRVRNRRLLHKALEAWAEGLDQTGTHNALMKAGALHDQATTLCQALEARLQLWSRHGVASVGRPPEKRAIERPSFATTTPGDRPYPGNSDGYRTEFQRDRDRIVWSRSLRQLANKTQVFPGISDDYLRHRLAHSLEVAQLATTIAEYFCLDEHLVEAGGLAHDVGHTPFGHAGEHGLDRLFEDIHPDLGGFNHYEHGVDVIRWLEDAYESPTLGGVRGLNVTPDVAECVFKHMYCHSSHTDRYPHEKLYAKSKHREYIRPGYGTVEAQAVRLADKMSYLISDLEDGLRTDVLTAEDLVSCALFRRLPVDIRPRGGESLHDRFVSQRPVLIATLMSDVLESTDRLLGSRKTLSAVINATSYTVAHSEEMQNEVNEIWARLQAGKLHKDPRVVLANVQSARLVRELTLLFAIAPELLDRRFAEGHRRIWNTEYMEYYRKRVGPRVQLKDALFDVPTLREVKKGLINTEHLIMAKDYVAGLSDERAREAHRRFFRV